MTEINKPLQCMVVDDEPLALSLLSDYITKTAGLTLAHAISNPLDAINYLKTESIDLIFLDMQMPELNGIQFMNILQKKSMVIVTTAYSEYALDGYQFNVLDYLLKPITMERFLIATDKAFERSRMNNALQNASNTPNNSGFIFIKTEHKIIRLNLADISCFEGARDYVVIHTPDEKILTLQSLKSIQEMLPADQFIRVHKSFIVALDKINFIERGRISLEDKIIPISETYKAGFYKSIGREITQ